ncbi:MAG: 30S ribosomal protein S17 [Dehalococcoidia bacterium]|nr:30S ribosomal protein S17 [Dehalococcoidia bacterium]
MEQTKRKSLTGRVLSRKMDKTVVVLVETRRRHPQYKKVVTYQAKFKAHDEGNECGVGDIVRIVESRPLSRDKRWRVMDIVNRAEVFEIKPTEIE